MEENQTQCDFIAGCPMFKYFRSIAKTIYTELYCQGNFEICARRRLRMENQPVPDNLLPHGGKLWDDDQRPPEMWGQ